jgi:hypothetical protein
VHLPRGGRRHLLRGPLLGVVVDHHDFVDDARREETLDDPPDRVALGIGHQDHGKLLVFPHGTRF